MSKQIYYCLFQRNGGEMGRRLTYFPTSENTPCFNAYSQIWSCYCRLRIFIQKRLPFSHQIFWTVIINRFPINARISFRIFAHSVRGSLGLVTREANRPGKKNKKNKESSETWICSNLKIQFDAKIEKRTWGCTKVKTLEKLEVKEVR